ncbi:MAG: hypothetical protein CML56_04985 [Rhodobacteraceae bacterium]|nr:hypothetical protein [Paracoccaceae bacterium]|tara:strand:+ start:332 stop:511 length:180 start_codon:yes stop_codon:yes gene_type:complete
MAKRGAYQPKKRQKKDDQLLNPGATREEIECDLATAEFDRTVRAMDQKWGFTRSFFDIG